MQELSSAITRQYIDAVAVFDALAEATFEAAHVRGGMYWHAGPASSPDSKYLVRTTPAGAETSLAACRTFSTNTLHICSYFNSNSVKIHRIPSTQIRPCPTSSLQTARPTFCCPHR